MGGDAGTYFHHLVAEHYDQLSPKQRAVAQVMTSNLEFSAFATTQAIAARAGANAATVVRFARAIGFKGFLELQQSLRHAYLSTKFAGEVVQNLAPHISPDTIVKRAILQDIRNLETLIRTVDDEQFLAAARAIRSAGRILVVSTGSYAALGFVLVHLLRFMGHRSVDLENRGGVYLAVQLGLLEPGDTVVTISFWKALREAALALRHARDHGITSVAITDQLVSPHIRVASHIIPVPTESPFFHQSTTAGLSVVYALIAALAAMDPDVSGPIKRIEAAYDDLQVFEPPEM